MTGHRATHRATWVRRALKSLSLPALGMAVMMIAGGAAVSTAGRGNVNVNTPPVPPRPAVLATPARHPVPQPSTPVKAAVTTTVNAAVVGTPVDQTWVVQVAAFASPERSVAMVKHLSDAGWPAYQVDPDNSTRGLTLVRVGPFRSSEEADAVRMKLRATPDYEGAFVRNITAK